MRASQKDIGTNIGKMIFRGSDTKRIERRLNKVGETKLNEALKKRGLAGVNSSDIADVLSGKDRAGWTASRLNKVVRALQDVGVAQSARTSHQMVLQASREAQERVKRNVKEVQYERRAEAAEKEALAAEPMGVLDRMRGAVGRANRRIPQTEAGATTKEGSSIRDLRTRLRKQLIKPTIRLSDQNKKKSDHSGFQP